MQTTSFWIEEPGKGCLRNEILPDPGPGDLRVRTLYTGISRGTEALVFRGQVPESLYPSMRAPFQQGEFPGPVKYGYCNVGVVEAGAEEWLGRNVFCLFPHQADYVVPSSVVQPIPADVPPERAILAANLETAINACWDAKVGMGDRIVVIGAGVVGLLCAWLCQQIPGTEVTVVDINPRRKATAERLGLHWTEPDHAPSGADLIIHASGQGEGLAQALNLAGVEATIVELSWYGTQAIRLPLGAAFHPNRLTVRSSQVGRLPPDRLPRWDYGRRLRLALKLLSAPALDALISGESTFAELPELMPRLSAKGADALCHRIRYP